MRGSRQKAAGFGALPHCRTLRGREAPGAGQIESSFLRLLRLSLVVAACGFVTSYATAAAAFRTGADLPELSDTSRVRWSAEAVTFYVASSPSPPIPNTTALAASQQAFATWNAVRCPGPVLGVHEATSGPATPGDGVNTIQWVTNEWRALGATMTAAAATDVQYERDSNGAWTIVEADLYLNAESFAWAPGQPGEFRDLLTVLTHEAGHVLGLLHPCEPGGEGGVAPRCDDLPFQDRVMFPLYNPSSTALSHDEVDGMCFLYPSGGEPNSSPPDGTAGSPCKEFTECLSGACIAGRCVLACNADAQCSKAERCDRSLGICVPILQEMGGLCSSADQCRSALCLAVDAAEGVCTQACNLDLDACSPGWTCMAAADESVCAPDSALGSGGGCSVSTVSRPLNAAPVGLSSLALVLLFAVRRRRHGSLRSLLRGQR